MIKLTLAALSLLSFTQVVQSHAVYPSTQQDVQSMAELTDSKLIADSPAPLKLAESSTEQFSTSTKDDKGGGAFASFVVGLFLIPFTLVLIWKNEKKIVMYAKVITKAKKALKGDVKTAIEDNDLDLVHTIGECHTDEIYKDEDFAIEVQNSYKMLRKCEMLQWIEHSEERDKRTYYTYTKEWRAHHVNSDFYNQSASHANPNNTWPFETKTTMGEKIDLNGFTLNKTQVERLGSYQTKSFDEETQATAITNTGMKMKNNGFAAFRHHDGYLYSCADGIQVESGMFDKVGTYRVSFQYAPCAQATVVAQQIEGHENIRTFRKWNPKKLNVPYGTETSADADKPCIDNMCLCCICICVNKIMNFAMEEVVDGCQDGSLSHEDFFAHEDQKVKNLEKFVRPLAIVGHILGWFLLFIPVITLLNFIPLVGSLLGFAAGIAAAIFAFVWGGVIASLVTGLAWLVFRPLFGICLLSLVGLGVYFIWFFPEGESAAPSEPV